MFQYIMLYHVPQMALKPGGGGGGGGASLQILYLKVKEVIDLH